MLKRCVRYLIKVPRVIQFFPWADQSESLEGFADSDWAGDGVGGKSTSGGVVRWGEHVLKTWSSTQTTIALSSGEAELYA